jgi:glycosyltransferase involved in cell wall biosynthesis
MRLRRRLLTIGHSYVVSLNRRLADALARAGEWEVTAVAPNAFDGDFGRHVLQTSASEACVVRGVDVLGSHPIHLMRYGRALKPILTGERWDLVHCWEEPYVLAAWQIARALPPDVPLVFATFQNISKSYPPPFRWIERTAMRRATGIVAFGHTVRETLRARGWSRVPTQVIPPGVDIERFRPDPSRRAATRRDLGWHDETPVIGFLGRLVPQKGLSVLTEALEHVSAPWRLLVVGSGPGGAAVRQWAARHPGRAAVVSGVAHDEVPAFVNAMDVLCAPSLTTPSWREQFGRMLIEAFAAGVPVIASDSGEIPFVVGETGIVVPEGDVAAWARAIDALLGDPARRITLAAGGRARAELEYAWDVVARRHLEFFEELVGAARRVAVPA